jgi:hypothetical protein
MQAKALGTEIGRRPEVVTRWAARGAEERLEDVEFKEAYEGLDRGLAERASLQH